MTDKIREEFQKAFLAKFGFGRMTALSNPDAAQMFEAAEWAWQASRESLVIELPQKDPAGSGGGDCGDGLPSEEQYVAAHCNIVLAQCRMAIEAAGLKVAP